MSFASNICAGDSIKGNHMPRSPAVHGAGRINMKGKKYKLMYCKCCVCIDFRDRELEKEHKKEMKESRYELDRYYS
jgi:hypothetical protein